MTILHAEAELEFRCAAMRAGFWLGWLSIAAVLAGLALGLANEHTELLLGLTGAAALTHTVAMAVPWRRWLAATRGTILLDLWSAGLLVFVNLLILLAGAHANFDLLLFLVLPFIATVHVGWRRVLWLSLAALAFAVAMTVAPSPLEAGAVAMRAGLLASAVALALALARATRREASARAEATARAELEHALIAEAHHRVKNSLQTVADLLLLARPKNGERAFDDTAARIRSIATVHRLLADAGGRTVRADEVVAAVTHAVDPAVAVETDPIELDAAMAQRLGIVANELVTNAVCHGCPPVAVRLTPGPPILFSVEDAGPSQQETLPGLGLRLVRQVVEHGLAGNFELLTPPEGGTRAEVRFEQTSHAHPRR